MPRYRLYIDEVGNPDLKNSENLNHRFLSLGRPLAPFAVQIIEILQEKYDQRGEVIYGKKFL